MSRLRRLVVSDRYPSTAAQDGERKSNRFFITCDLLRSRNRLELSDFETLAEVMQARRQEHGFLLTAWVFLPDHWHAILSVRYPKSISLVLESVKVSSTRQINTRRRESGRLWQGRFFDRALRTVKDGPPLSPLLIEEGTYFLTPLLI